MLLPRTGSCSSIKMMISLANRIEVYAHPPCGSVEGLAINAESTSSLRTITRRFPQSTNDLLTLGFFQRQGGFTDGDSSHRCSYHDFTATLHVLGANFPRGR